MVNYSYIFFFAILFVGPTRQVMQAQQVLETATIRKLNGG
jgi:hypothetical protein